MASSAPSPRFFLMLKTSELDTVVGTGAPGGLSQEHSRGEEPHLPPRNRIKQSARHPLRLPQDSLPPMLYYKRHSRICTNTFSTHLPGTNFPQPPRRPRKLYTRPCFF
uniref:Uncharacterized protein n=1 Tax=Zonotrichia albicollis TaxID=44394 RepID=A0A8D2NAT3_ZONAL